MGRNAAEVFPPGEFIAGLEMIWPRFWMSRLVNEIVAS